MITPPSPPWTTLALQVAESAAQPDRREAYRQWSSMMLVLILLALIAVTVLAFIVMQRRARRRRDVLPKRPDQPRVDAWEESGRRFDDSITQFDDDQRPPAQG